MHFFGLDRATSDVYHALLRAPYLTVEGLASRAGVSRVAVQRALRSLASRGLVRQDAVASSGYEPARPDSVLGGPLRQAEAALHEQSAAIREGYEQMFSAVEEYLAGRELLDSTLDLERVDGLAAVRARVDEIVGEARSELLVVVTKLTDDPRAVEAARDEDLAILARGVRLRSIYPTTVREMPLTWAYALETAAAGEEMRLSDEAPVRMLVVDGQVVMIPLDPANLDAGALIVRSQPVVAAYAALFELCWGRATPAFAAAQSDLPDRQRRLVDLLAAGAKDDTIARHLGIHVRTVRRDIAELMEDLGAATRFQAGLEAARRYRL